MITSISENKKQTKLNKQTNKQTKLNKQTNKQTHQKKKQKQTKTKQNPGKKKQQQQKNFFLDNHCGVYERASSFSLFIKTRGSSEDSVSIATFLIRVLSFPNRAYTTRLVPHICIRNQTLSCEKRADHSFAASIRATSSPGSSRHSNRRAVFECRENPGDEVGAPPMKQH